MRDKKKKKMIFSIDCPDKVDCIGNPCMVHSCGTGEACVLDDCHGLCEPICVSK